MRIERLLSIGWFNHCLYDIEITALHHRPLALYAIVIDIQQKEHAERCSFHSDLILLLLLTKMPNPLSHVLIVQTTWSY